jgi:hypothetical protein
MRSGTSSALLLILGVLAAGCGPPVSDEELGRVVIGVPEIPEGYEPYTLPSLVATDPAASQAASSVESQTGEVLQSAPGDVSP